MQIAQFTLYDDRNRRVEHFAGPFRLAQWADLPAGWSIEEFWGTVSKGMISLDEVKRIAADIARERNGGAA